jgi:hypothetical protein
MLKLKKTEPVSIPGIYQFCKSLFLSIFLFLFLSFPSCDNSTSSPSGAETVHIAVTVPFRSSGQKTRRITSGLTVLRAADVKEVILMERRY